MERNCFKFKLVDMKEFSKGDKNFYRIVCYCSFGFIVNLFTTPEKAMKLNEIVQKDKNTDISNYINVFYDNNKQQFAYVINLK